MNEYQDFITPLRQPAVHYGEVPFYWWSGDTLDKPRLRAQLEALAAGGVAGVQINYSHLYRGGEEDAPFGGAGRSMPGDPCQFSEDWWDFFAYAASVCEALGIGIGVGDYTLAWIGNGFFTDRVAAVPGMNAQTLSAERLRIFGFEDVPDPDSVLAVVTYADADFTQPRVLYERGGERSFPYGCYDAFILRTKTVPFSIDPMHQDSGRLLTELYFKEFERRLPQLRPGTLNYFFQDELLFGADVKTIWREDLRTAVAESRGYDPLGFLPHLFFELGPLTAKIRLDIADVRTRLMEERYFRPVYDFHAQRGLIYGCDQSGRGRQPDEFSDYFRTVRWFTAPGNDTPGRAADLIKVKVNASIADLYDRPRVWLEGYHSSGWGTAPQTLTAPTDDNFMFGANLLNLHGLYYSTNGGFYEWAPPDFHFRMPYWADFQSWLSKYKSLSAVLTTGRHVCDAAVFYPVSSFDYGVNADFCREETFRTAEYLFAHGVDFSFLDFQSIERAEVKNGLLVLPNAEFRAVFLCGVDCVRFSVMEKLRDFAQSGGCVIFTAITPYLTDLVPAEQPKLTQAVSDILSCSTGGLCRSDAEALRRLNAGITRRFLPDADDPSEKTYCVSRTQGSQTLFFVRYCSRDSVCRFRTLGQPFLLDPVKKTVARLTGTVQAGGFTFVKMPLEADADTLLLFTDEFIPFDDELNTAGFANAAEETVWRAEGDWDLTLLPTLDNTYGDFYLPAGGMIGPEARFFRRIADNGEPLAPQPYCVSGNIARVTGCENVFELCRRCASVGTLPTETVEILPLHDRYGYIHPVPNTPEACHEQGFHGLKGRVYDYNFYFSEDSVFLTDVFSEGGQEAYFRLTGMLPDVLWLNGEKIEDPSLPVKLPAGRSRIAAGFVYDAGLCPDFVNRAPLKRAGVYLTTVAAPQRTGFPLSVSAFANPDYLPFLPVGPTPETYTFDCVAAPGTYGFTGCFFGELLSASLDGSPLTLRETGTGFFGGRCYTAEGARCAHAPRLRFTVHPAPGRCGTGMIPEPLRLLCGPGRLPCGDASAVGALKNYSGRLSYKKTLRLKKYEGERYLLSLGTVRATARVLINGRPAAVLPEPPFLLDATDFLTDGENALEIIVSNTLCNHYSTVPSGYSCFPAEADYGLFGPVELKAVEL